MSLVNGPFGDYTRGWQSGVVPVRHYAPSSGDQPRSLVILTSGANTNETCFIDLPAHLMALGHKVSVKIFPGYEAGDPNHNPTKLRCDPTEQLNCWLSNMPRATINLMMETPEDRAIFLGGFSMGGAEALLTLAQLPPQLQARVKGLILVAPSLRMTKLEKYSKPVNWLLRNVYLPLNSWADRLQSSSGYSLDPTIQAHTHCLSPRPFRAQFAAARFCETAERVLGETPNDIRNTLPVLLVHSGKTDKTVHHSSTALVKAAFAKVDEMEVAWDHWLLGHTNRAQVQGRIGAFLAVHTLAN